MSERLPISVVVLTFNDGRTIQACLKSVAFWADEVHVVDSGSTDHTMEIVKRYTSNIVSHPFENYAAQRNWAQSQLRLRNEWVLHLDAGEVVSPELAHSIDRFFNSPNATTYNGAMMARRTIFLDRWIRHGGLYPVFHLRLFKTGQGYCEDRLYDQHFLVNPPVATLSGDLLDTCTASLHEWSLKHLRWATAEVEQQLQPVTPDQRQVAAKLFGTPIERRRWLRNTLFRRMPPFARAFGYFGYRYIVQGGFLDGPEGLIYHFLHACWYRFYIDARLWETRRVGPIVRDSG